MRVIFIGSSEIAIPSLEKILDSSNHNIVGIISQPDKPAGRKQKLSSTALKSFALSKGLSVFTPESISSTSTHDFLKNLVFDIFIIVGYGQFIPDEVISLAKFKAINLHPSLLPQYRGASPIQYSLLNGDKKTGISIIKVTDKMDAGDIILQKEVNIDHQDNFLTLHDKLATIGSNVLIDALNNIENKSVIGKAQDDSKATFTKKILKKDGLINWTDSAENIYNKIRAYNPWPGCYSFLPTGERITIWKASITSDEGNPGLIVSDKFIIATGTKSLSVLELQISGKKKMDIDSFLNGNKISKNKKMKINKN